MKYQEAIKQVLLEQKKKQEKPSLLTAVDHINRLIADEQHLVSVARTNKKQDLIKELKGHRSELSWLIGKLERSECLTS